MDRDEVLAKSRAENRDKDVFEKEVLQEGGNIGGIAASILALIFFVVRLAAGGGLDYGMWAVVIASLGASFVVKAVRLRRRHEMAVAAGYVLLALALSAAHIYELITA